MKTRQILILLSIIILTACKKDKLILLPVPNGDFESWNALSPKYWKTNSCPFCLPPFDTYIVQQDSSPYEGKFAAKFIYNNVYPAWAENKFAISNHPDNLTAFVKCNLYGNDTVSVKIKLLKNTTVVDSGQWFGTANITKYTQINIPVTQSLSKVDTAIITILGGHKQGYPLNNTEFWIDNLELK